jgi:hypothetical protein
MSEVILCDLKGSYFVSWKIWKLWKKIMFYLALFLPGKGKFNINS